MEVAAMYAAGDAIAEAVLAQFDALPPKAKPLGNLWVPMSGIVAQGQEGLTCLVVATGMKCLPQTKVAQAAGIVLHDWHAEILAIRSLNRFLLSECLALAQSPDSTSLWVRRRTPDERTEAHFQPFALHDEIDLHMYCSEAPCGDASMELTQASQINGEPWVVPVKEVADGPDQVKGLQGRSYFSELGIIRRKPSRPDAPPTLSKSCSDKLALKQCTSILSSPVSMLISPSNAYLKTLVVPESQYSEIGCQRAFSAEGRLKDLEGRTWEGGYKFKSFQVRTTKKEFRYSRRQEVTVGEKLVPSNLSAGWVRDVEGGKGSLEMIIAGVKQGRKQFDVRGASRVSKSAVWSLAVEVAALMVVPDISRCLGWATYGDIKGSTCLRERMSVKEEVWEKGLKGWIRNEGGEEFGIGRTISDGQ